MLVLANKQDIKGALTPEEIAKVRLLAHKIFLSMIAAIIFVIMQIRTCCLSVILNLDFDHELHHKNLAYLINL